MFLVLSAAMAQPKAGATADQPPRKIIVGTVVRGFWAEDPVLDKRLAGLAAVIDQMAAQSQSKYGRGIDLAVLPETAVTAGRVKGIEAAVPFEGQVQKGVRRKGAPTSLLHRRAHVLAGG